MKTFTKSAIAAASLLALAGTAYAATEWPSFSQLDKNNDGVLEKKEAKSAKGLDFKTADTDNDGKISQTEYQTAMLKTGQGSESSTSPGSSSGSGDMGTSSPGSSSNSGMGGSTPQPYSR